ncbi:MAG: fumarylacetoacetate hydrolase family protein [Bacteroidota bacterium]
MKIFCIGRNYAAHAAEMKAEKPSRPLVFMKPPTALLVNNKPFYIPDFTQEVHHEIELVIKISKNGRHIDPTFAADYIESVGLGIDFTARDLQAQLKAKGHPWEISKGFDSSAPISGEFLSLNEFEHAQDIEFGLRKNGELVQYGRTKDLLFPFEELIVYISRFFRLQKGDLIFTGTPEGVGQVNIGDELVGFVKTREGEREMLVCRVK